MAHQIERLRSVARYLQVSWALATTVLPLFFLAGSVAVTVTGPAVEPRQVAVPKLPSLALLMATFTSSDTDQTTPGRPETARDMQPSGMSVLSA